VIAAPLAPGLVANLSQKPCPIEGPYFVIISTIVSRKNHLLLLHLWRKLVNELDEKTPKLVIIGKRSPECSSTLAMLDRCKQIGSYIIETTASDSDLQQYLTHAVALLFPTFAEGYGLPLIEALSFNVPVIVSDLAIFREIAGAIPEYLDPIDGKGWLEMILNYTQEHSEAREAQLKRLAEFTIPTWSDHFDIVNVFLKHLSSKTSPSY
jgi:glycosyltransferase involved in cell wall biosynthesis